MNFFRVFSPNYWRDRAATKHNIKEKNLGMIDLHSDDDFHIVGRAGQSGDGYFLNAWANIAVGILTRNVARARFMLVKNGNEIAEGPLFELFRRPNEMTSCYDLWKETAAWWHLEGEAFWWFGPEYAAGIPKAIYILDPRRMRHEEPLLRGVEHFVAHKHQRWFYQTDTDTIPILRDELIHFRDWNPWNPARGVTPLAALALELEQDFYANKANSQLLKNNAVPQGILKTEQSIRPEEADALERRWEQKYGAARASRKIAVLGKGTEFKPLSFTPEVVKLFELKRWNLYTILAKYGIPPRVANISDRSTALSGKDTGEQHAAFWKYTLIPLLKHFEQILETQFFSRLGLRETGVFDLRDIPELQESEDAQSSRDIAEINAGLKTINDVLRERGKDPKPWGDLWHRPKNLLPVDQGGSAKQENGYE
jgi:HK97 family phage portal protein